NDFLIPGLNNVTDACQQSILADMTDELSMDFPPQCSQSIQRSGMSACELVKNQTELFFERLAPFFPPEALSRYSPICSNISIETLSALDLQNVSHFTRTLQSCSPLSNGQSRIINRINPGTNVGSNYKLRKINERHYQATINLNFSPTDYTERANNCLNNAN